MSGDRPDARELVEAVAAWLGDELVPALEGGARFQALVAVQALGIAARELEHGPELARRDGAALGDLGELAADLRAGRHDDDLPRLAAALREHVGRKLTLARPGYDGS